MSSSSGDYKQPSTPQPAGNSTPYGQASSVDPSWISFLPTSLGGDGRMQMATGLTQGMLDQIGGQVDPLERIAEEYDSRKTGMDATDTLTNRDAFAQMMADYEEDKKMAQFRNAALEASGVNTSSSVYNTGANPWLGGGGTSGNR